MNIAFIGKFKRIYDEEYIARSFEMLGHTVTRIEEGHRTESIIGILNSRPFDLVLWSKLQVAEPHKVINHCRLKGLKTVAWIFDLYFGYAREYRVSNQHCFKADVVVTTDGGHDQEWKQHGIKHVCVRQGIFKDECYMEKGEDVHDVVFVGSENGLYPYRSKLLTYVNDNFEDFTWFGRFNTHEVRSTALNELYGRSKIVLGDSVYSPYYWSNRVVETLGRGGLLIHPNVPGIQEEYPDLVTYEHNNFQDLKQKIDYYLANDKEREALRKKNFNWVKKHYTMEKKCKELLSKI